MQGKEASEQETQEAQKCSAGIDVSKNWLDGHILPASKSLRVANTQEGIRQLKRWLLKHEVGLVAVEATGKWHRVLCRSLAASPIRVAVPDPYRVRMFAKAQGIFAKTDKLDARVLAMFAALMAPSCRAPAPQALEALQELVTARTSAVAMSSWTRWAAGGGSRARTTACIPPPAATRPRPRNSCRRSVTIWSTTTTTATV